MIGRLPVTADRYELYRVYPTQLAQGAHAGSGKFRLDAFAGARTLFGIDRETYAVLSAGWQTPRGFHQRVYSEFYRVGERGFLQPGRVRHCYDGVKGVDIRWTPAEVGVPIPDAVFVLGPGVESAR